MERNKIIQCDLCKNYITYTNLKRHKRTEKCIKKEVSNHLDKFWIFNQIQIDKKNHQNVPS